MTSKMTQLDAAMESISARSDLLTDEQRASLARLEQLLAQRPEAMPVVIRSGMLYIDYIVDTMLQTLQHWPNYQ